MRSAVCLALANGIWIDMMETTMEWKCLEPLHGSPMASFPLCHSNCTSLSKGLLQSRSLQEEAMRITYSQRTVDKQHEWGGKKIFSVESQRNLGLGCHCNIVWRKLANRACEPISANEREQIPGPAGLLVNKSLLYSVLGDVQLESWTQSQTRKVGPREGPEPRFIWNQFYFLLMMAYRNHFLFNPGWVGFSFTCNWEVAY